jgi:hypothetical protein
MFVQFICPRLGPTVLVLCALAATAGCRGEAPMPAGVPKGAALLAEAVGPIGERDVDHDAPWEVEADGLLYLRNVTAEQVTTRPVKAGQTLTLYPGWISVSGLQVDRVTGRHLPQRFIKERIIARFTPGNRYEIYYRALTAQELAKAAPATRPAAEHTLVPLEPIPVLRRRDAGAVERPTDGFTPVRPPAAPPEEPEAPPVLVPVPH